MKNTLLLLFALSLFGCQQPANQNTVANMEFGGWSGTSDDHSKESLMAREFNDYYVNNTFSDGAYMISDQADEFFFNSVKVDKAGWINGASDHHNYFDDISNNKLQPYNLTTTTFDNGSVWTQCWFYLDRYRKIHKNRSTKSMFTMLFRWEQGKNCSCLPLL